MPTLQKLADNGLMYTQWHTTALCSPTRSTLLTGRNHHLNGMASITEAIQRVPGCARPHPGRSAPPSGQILQDDGYSTFWLGKNHNVPETDVAAGASRKQWPLQKGFDRFYGFLGGETNHWYPDLVEDNHLHRASRTARRRATTSPKTWPIRRSKMIRDQKAANPSQARGTCGSAPGPTMPRTMRPQEYIDKYKGKFDDGYEAYREWVLPRMIAKGVLPAGHAS